MSKQGNRETAAEQQVAADKRRLGRALRARTSLMRRLPLNLVFDGRHPHFR
jgi:hypothetical protein